MAERGNSTSAGTAGPTHRLPPHNLEAERSLLGAMLLRSDAVAAAVGGHRRQRFLQTGACPRV